MLEKLSSEITQELYVETKGSVEKVRRDSVRVRLPKAKVGATCTVDSATGPISLEIVSLDHEGHVAMPLDDLSGIQLGDPVRLTAGEATVSVGAGLLGRVVDSLGTCYETGEKLVLSDRGLLYGQKLNPMDRELIRKPVDLGIRSLNGLLTCGVGQRLGIFAGAGVGKSVLLGMMARYTSVDVVVMSLIGERGREVREFIENDLGVEGRKKSVVIVETSDKSPVRRVRAAQYSAAVCEHFRSKGANVLWMMDSMTRFAMAQREIGIAAGEPPATKGYSPSVFSSMAKLAERAGNWGALGSITGLFTVLVEGDDLEDPIADSVRSILDGHIILSRKLANRGQFPAIDVLSSVSRVMDQIVTPDHLKEARVAKAALARYLENEDAIQYGMYARGSDPSLDECIELEPRLREFLTQGREERSSFGESRGLLTDLVSTHKG